MTKLTEMREKRAKLVADARAELDKIKDDTSEADAKEYEGRFDAAMAEVDVLDQKIEREQKIAEAEARQAEIVEKQAGKEDRTVERKDEPETREEKEIFSDAMRFGVNALSAEERAILGGMRANLSQEERAQSVGTDAAGGYTVPEGFSGEIDKALAAWGPMLDTDVARQYPTASGNPIPWPTVDDTAKTAELKAENAAATDDGGNDVVFGQKVLNSYLYDSEVVKVSIELLNDSAFEMEGLLDELFGERLGRSGNTALTTGSGSSQPNGIVTGSSLGKTAAGAAAITADELIDLQHSVDPAYRQSPKCRWMFNDTTLAAIRKLKDSNGQYLWQMGNIQVGAPDTILGKPYSINQAMASLATGNKTVIFGDIGRYVVRRVGGVTMLALRERYAENLQVGFISYMRIDGELLNTAAVKHLIQA